MSLIQFSKDKALDIIPIGRVAIDFNPVDAFCPLENSTTFKKYVGGSPANIAVGMAKLGKNVGFISNVSDDAFGRFVLQSFQGWGVDTSHIQISNSGASLGLTFTEIKSPVESNILMYRTGVSDLEIDPMKISRAYIGGSKILLVSGTALAQSPSREAVFTAIEYAKQENVKIIFDIDFRNYTWKNKNEIAVYYSLVGKMSDIILGSREEFTLMEQLLLPGNEDDGVTAKLWQGYGNKIVVVKHGKEGSTAYTADGKNYSVKPFPVDVLKSFGGGDGYASAFIYALLEGMAMPEALEFASASASILVSAHSCSEAMPTVAEIQQFIQEKKAIYGDDVVYNRRGEHA